MGVAILIAGGAAVFVAGALLSLDWDREHAARTAELPLVTTARADGLVRIPARSFVFRARVAGLDNTGRGVVLLHGFPESSAMWIPLIEAAAARGHRVVAFDQRGYSPGARPEGVESYVVPELVEDVRAVADAVGFERFHLVGHDWGCVVGWSFVLEHPERVLSWSALSIPHPGALSLTAGDDPPAYIRFFQSPWLPELLFSWNGQATLHTTYEVMPEAQRDEYLALFAEPGALTAALNWYRAIGASVEAAADDPPPIQRSVQFIWGSGEFWVTPEAREKQRTLVTGPYAELELDTSHWLMEEAPDRVVETVLAHLARVDER